MTLSARLVAMMAVVAALAASAPARADVIELKDSARVEGRILSEKCQDCAGTGSVDCPGCAGTGLKGAKPCPACAGAKRVDCAACGGLGVRGDKVRIQVRAGTVEIERQLIRRLIWREVDLKTLLSPADFYKQAMAKLDPKDARGAFELATWCAANGMDAEARGLFAAAAGIDPALDALAKPHLAELGRRRETAAAAALAAALTIFEGQGPGEAAAALRAFRKDYGETELARRSELQRDLVRRQCPKLAEAGTDTVEELLRTAEDRLAARCEACAGSGREKCPDCAGTGGGRCPDCGGGGQVECPVCAGTKLLTCQRCLGTGYTRSGAGLGYNFDRVCPECEGRKEMPCDVCGATGKRPCKRCDGTGRLAGSCRGCAGGGTIQCRTCGGSGIKPVALFLWGPPPVRQPGIINVGGGNGRSRAWQGDYSGGTVTVLGSEVLYRGALATQVAGASGKKLRVLAVALDNRDGKKLMRFKPGDKCLRGVTEDHAQIEAVDLPKLLAAGAGAGTAVAPLLARASDRDCLPGAYECVLVALPEGTDLDALAGLYWLPGATAEPVRLAPIWLADDEVAELRKSLR